MLKFVSLSLVILILHNSSARPQAASDVSVVSLSQNVDVNGNFAYAFETSDGTKQEQTGTQKDITVGDAPEKGIC